MDIDTQVLERAARNLRRIMLTHHTDIATAYLRADDELSVGLTVKFRPTKNGSGTKIKTEINFIAERVKDSDEDEVYPPDPLQIAIERAQSERDAARKIGNTPGTWARMRGYRHR